MAWSPDGTKLASGSSDDTLKIWNAKTGKCESTLTVDKTVTSVAFSPDGSKIAAAHWKEISIFDAQTQAKLGWGDKQINCVAFSPDGKIIAVGDGGLLEAGSVRLYDTVTGDIKSTLSGHSR